MFVLGRSRLLPLLLLLLLPRNNQATDGCQGEGGLGLANWRCGDVCTGRDVQCFCGNSKFKYDDGKWCCATNCTGGGCLQWREGHKEGDASWHCLEWEPAKCTTGVALNLTESCGQSHRCNYHGEDEHRSWLISRSHVAACANTSTCVKEGEGNSFYSNYKLSICTGDSSCEGELDWCKKEERKEEKCPAGFIIRCPGISSNKEGGHNGKNFIPGQCIELKKAKDGKENNCLDRSDEDLFQEAVNATNKETIIDFGSLKNCTRKSSIEGVDYERPGLECGRQGSSDCIRMDLWCKDKKSKECPVLGEGIRTNDPTLCANVSFWRKLSCGKETRCQAGNSGQCVGHLRWGADGNWGRCSDGSDLYRPIEQATETEDPGSQATQADSIEQGSDNGEQRINNDGDENNAEEEEKPLKKGYLPDKRDPPTEAQARTVLWNTGPETEETYDKYYRGKEKGAKYVKDVGTGLWMLAVSEESCKASQGFVCKVRLCTFEMNHDDANSFGYQVIISAEA